MVKINTNLKKNCQNVKPLLNPSQMAITPTPRIIRTLMINNVHEVYALAVNEAEASVVRMIFDKYVNEGYGAQRIATWLNNQGLRARSGKHWHRAL